MELVYVTYTYQEESVCRGRVGDKTPVTWRSYDQPRSLLTINILEVYLFPLEPKSEEVTVRTSKKTNLLRVKGDPGVKGTLSKVIELKESKAPTEEP